MSSLSHSEKVQKEHFNILASKYNQHYGGKESQRYRKKFINIPLLEGLDIRGKLVLDGMCGNGETASFLLDRGGIITAIDISEEMTKTYKEKFPGCEVKCASILDTGIESNYFDFVVIVGGLHHLHPNVSNAVKEIHRILKPDGYFCFMEPHTGSLPDTIRKMWYLKDKYFADNEASVDIKSLEIEFAGKFETKMQKYTGNLAFLFVYNSMIFRIPLWLKPIYSKQLIWLEGVFEKLQRKSTSCITICQWKKSGTS